LNATLVNTITFPSESSTSDPEKVPMYFPSEFVVRFEVKLSESWT